MANLNKVLLIGRLTRDPELRYTPQGTAVTEIGVAVSRTYTVGNERREETTFVDVTLWSRQAEVVCQWLKKGRQIFIEGRLTLDRWEDKEGQKRSKLRVIAESFQFMDDRGDSGGGSSEGGDYGRSYTGGGRSPAEGRRIPADDEFAGAPASDHTGGEPDGLGVPEEDIPF